jgi:uncharacterized protein (DUF433 family)
MRHLPLAAPVGSLSRVAAPAAMLTGSVRDMTLTRSLDEIQGNPSRRTPACLSGILVPMRFERITVNPAQMGGQPCMRGLRIPVATVVAMVADGMTAQEVVGALPDLTLDDVSEALHYAAAAVQEKLLPILDLA